MEGCDRAIMASIRKASITCFHLIATTLALAPAVLHADKTASTAI